MTNRLAGGVLSGLAPAVRRPGYDRSQLQPGIVHLGLGAFHRAHQAVYTEDVLDGDSFDPRWGTIGVSLRSPAVRDALAPQDGLYTLAVRSGAGTDLRVIGSIVGVMVGPEDPNALVDTLVRPETRIVSLTVTEKGYCRDPATGDLDPEHPWITEDLAHPARPHTAIGLITEALARRRAVGLPPFTVLCCDNLPANGRTVARVIGQFAKLRDRDLARWISDTVSFPSTMVDRITPATTDEDRAEIDAALGCRDHWPVVTEPFTQWVIEDRFSQGRPLWEAAGAQVVDDVEPYELMKLRLLNGSHSTMAYLGFMAGYATVDRVVADPNFVRFVRGLWLDEVRPTLRPLAGMDLDAYQDALLQRYANPSLKHATKQIAMDGSQKLPMRLLSTARERLAAGAPVPRIGLAVAGWIHYVGGVGEDGVPHKVDDPLAADLLATLQGAGADPTERVAAVLGIQAVFGDDLGRAPGFVEAVTDGYRRLVNEGVKAVIASWD